MAQRSEIAMLLERIELETQAMQLALHGYATVAKHQFISHRYDEIGVCQEQLQTLVGEKQATALIIATYTKSMNEEGETLMQAEETLFSQPNPITALTTPPMTKEAKEIIAQYCRIIVEGNHCRVLFPEGTLRREIYPRMYNQRYHIELPDGFCLREVFDRGREQSLLFFYRPTSESDT